MSDQRNGGITWTEETWNVIRGCRRVNDDCRNCYAERLAATRLSSPPQFAEGAGGIQALVKPAGAYWGLAEMTDAGPRWTGKIDLVEDILDQPLRWQRPRLIFTNAMSDLFYEDLTFEDIDRVVAVMALAGQHTFQVLTKRWARMADYLASRAKSIKYLEAAAATVHRTFNYQGISLLRWPIPNIWWGGSAGHQKAMDAAGPHLLRCRPHATVLWLSAEPLWSGFSIAKWLPHSRETSQTTEQFYRGFDWVVDGGESGPKARPCHPDWIRQHRDECAAAGVPFHFKQWGEWLPNDAGNPIPANLNGVRWHQFDDEAVAYWVGKKAAGRLLDGVVHDAYPARRAA